MLYMLYSVLNTLLPHVGRKSVFLFMYLLHVLQYPQSTTSPTKRYGDKRKPHFLHIHPTNISYENMNIQKAKYFYMSTRATTTLL